MVHPLFKSKNGAILYRELPEVMRLYDNCDPGAGRLGDLEAYLFGFGHLLDRFDATLEQFHADGFLDPVVPAGDEVAIQGWLLPYVAELFGVELVAPDPDSRRRELAASIWIARRRGTKAAIDHAAETLLDAPVVVVDGGRRVLRTPKLVSSLTTHREVTGLWHPKDANILLEELPPTDPTTHETGFAATRPAAHAGLPLGTPDTRRRMRARAGGLIRPDADVRPIDGSGTEEGLASFFIADRRGVPCFADSYEDRSLRTPDMRTPRANRPRFTTLKKPDAVTLFVRPPAGFFDAITVTITAAPELAAGAVVRPDALPEDAEIAQAFFEASAETLVVTPETAGDDGRHVIDGLKFDGTVEIATDTDVHLEHCAIGTLRFAADYAGRAFGAWSSIFGSVEADGFAITDGGPAVLLEYVTVIGPAAFGVLLASDCLFLGPLTVAGDGGEGMVGCVRFSRVPEDFDRSHVHVYQSTFGPADLMVWPCIEEEPGTFVARVPVLGEKGFGVLSDVNPDAVRRGAEDGGELGAYHTRHHLARLDAAVRKAEAYAPAGRQVFAIYDKRLLATLPV